jgi:hypothetical protein
MAFQSPQSAHHGYSEAQPMPPMNVPLPSIPPLNIPPPLSPPPTLVSMFDRQPPNNSTLPQMKADPFTLRPIHLKE